MQTSGSELPMWSLDDARSSAAREGNKNVSGRRSECSPLEEEMEEFNKLLTE